MSVRKKFAESGSAKYVEGVLNPDQLAVERYPTVLSLETMMREAPASYP
jgi:hypothetical protein